MWYAGVDLRKRNSEVIVLTATGLKVLEVQVKSTAEALRRIFATLDGRGEIACTASSLAYWLADSFQDLEITVRIGDPSRLWIIGRKRSKKDRIEARFLAELLRTGAFPAIQIVPQIWSELTATAQHPYIRRRETVRLV
ncbi:MAG: transposase [Planctomycetes bacterium]|nr:transposase [Planctomycetota bacterium]